MDRKQASGVRIARTRTHSPERSRAQARQGGVLARPRGHDPFLERPQRFVAVFMSLVLSLSLCFVPETALATTGKTAVEDVGMEYYFGTGGSHNGHNLLKLGSSWVYCMNPSNHFKAGLTLTGVDAVAGKKLSQACVTDLALAYRYVWDEGLYRTPSGRKLKNDLERYAATQVLMWGILSERYPTKDWPSHNRITINGTDVTGDSKTSGNNKDAMSWIAANRSRYIGHCEFFEGNDAQDFAFKFTSELQVGNIALTKRSANAQITDGNRCYSLTGAKYGVYSDGACTKLAATLETDAQGKAEARELPVGTYYVKETARPAGYALDANVWAVDVQANKTVQVNSSAGYVPEAPQANRIDLWVVKADAETADGGAQGSATLEGARFRIDYYDGYYNADTLPSSPLKSWTVTTDAQGRAVADDALKVGGDDFYRTSDGRIAVPLGTVVIREVEAPRGYHLGNGSDDDGIVKIVRVTAGESTSAYIQTYEAPTVSDYVKRGGVMVGKVDRQNGEYLPQGSATLAGAQIEIVTNNEQQVVVDGSTFLNGSVVKTIETVEEEDGKFVARTGESCLPVGTYTLREAGTSQGYLLDGESLGWRQSFEITEEGEVVDLTGLQSAVSNQVIRGDIEFSKADGQTAERLGNVAFSITSQTTGESHVLVTDENGMASTAADWNSHEQDTNANDDAVTVGEDGSIAVDGELLDPHAGIWFDGRVDAPVDADDELGALPFDTYTVEELPSTANEGYELVKFTTVVSRNARSLDLGTVDDNAGPLIGTSLADADGNKVVAADSQAFIVDAVSYANVSVGKSYAVEGELHLVGEDGDEGVVATGSADVTPTSPAGSANVEFVIDTSGLAGKKLVAFERLVDAEGDVVAAHEDLSDEGQTVRIPSLATELANADESAAGASTAGTTTLVDAVSYEGLAPGRAYTVTGTLHVKGSDGNDAGPALDADGNAIASQATFVAAAPEGTVDVVFTFNAPELAGKNVVAFEELSLGGKAYAVHADIGAESQTASFPGIATVLEYADGGKEAPAQEAAGLVDTVSYSNLEPDRQYTLTGTLHVIGADGADEGELKDASGTTLRAKTIFVPEQAEGKTTVEFSADASTLGGKSLVAFETLAAEDGTLLATHEDIGSQPQTVSVTKPEKQPEKVEKTTPTAPLQPESTGKTGAKGKAIVKTGDPLPVLGLMLVPLGIAAIGVAALSIKRLRKDARVRIDRGPSRL